jgi:hypothetical protein
VNGKEGEGGAADCRGYKGSAVRGGARGAVLARAAMGLVRRVSDTWQRMSPGA